MGIICPPSWNRVNLSAKIWVCQAHPAHPGTTGRFWRRIFKWKRVVFFWDFVTDCMLLHFDGIFLLAKHWPNPAVSSPVLVWKLEGRGRKFLKITERNLKEIHASCRWHYQDIIEVHAQNRIPFSCKLCIFDKKFASNVKNIKAVNAYFAVLFYKKQYLNFERFKKRDELVCFLKI